MKLKKTSSYEEPVGFYSILNEVRKKRNDIESEVRKLGVKIVVVQ